MLFLNYRLLVVESNRARSVVRARPLERTGTSHIGGRNLERRPIEQILSKGRCQAAGK